MCGPPLVGDFANGPLVETANIRERTTSPRCSYCRRNSAPASTSSVSFPNQTGRAVVAASRITVEGLSLAVVHQLIHASRYTAQRTGVPVPDQRTHACGSGTDLARYQGDEHRQQADGRKVQ
jgi:hypothetical protein